MTWFVSELSTVIVAATECSIITTIIAAANRWQHMRFMNFALLAF
jgi:hypothetical protein